MTRGQFAIAVGTSEKWVHNATMLIGARIAYTPAAARRLTVARAIQALSPVTLAEAYRQAESILDGPLPQSGTVVIATTAGGVVTLDLRRVLSTFAAQLGRALQHEPRRPGRPARRGRRQDARSRAAAYGVDLSLIDSTLRRSVPERLAALDENVAFRDAVRVAKTRRKSRSPGAA